MNQPKQPPLVALEGAGQATILSYNVPEPTSYPGRNFIDLPFAASYFKPEFAEAPERALLSGKVTHEQMTAVVRDSLMTGYLDRRVFPLAQGGGRVLASVAGVTTKAPHIGSRGTPAAKQWNPNTGEVTDIPDPDEEPDDGSPPQNNNNGDGKDDAAGEIAGHIIAGENIAVFTDMWGNQVPVYVPAPTVTEPRIMLVEEYRLSTYLGSYGAGRVVQTMTLLPGEKTSLSVKSYTRSTTTAAQASSILDSFSEDSATEFLTAVQNEQSDQDTYAKSFEYNAETEASASWGVFSASVSGGVAGSTNSSREEFAKNVSSATDKTSSAASSKREVQVNTSSEVSTEAGEETSITREISNINLSAPLNFVFRQMNQEFITFLHLVDVRVSFFNNFVESKRERPLSELDDLLDEVMVDDKARKDEVRAQVIHALTHIFDWRGQLVTDAVRQRGYPELDGGITKVWHYNRDKVTEYVDPASGATFTVPGVVLSVQKKVMRTEGILVESILSLGRALDPYNISLQDEALRERRLANEAADLANRREEQAQRIVGSGADNLAATFATVFAPGNGEAELELEPVT